MLFLKKFLYLQPLTRGTLAQLVEQRTENPCVPGSIPGGTTLKPDLLIGFFVLKSLLFHIYHSVNSKSVFNLYFWPLDKKMQLVIDVGNTRVKAAVFNEALLIGLVIIDKTHFDKELEALVRRFPIKKAIISSVGKLSDSQKRSVQLRFPTTVLSHTTPVPFTNTYSTPETLGVDRIGLMAAFAKAYPNKSGLVIDAGSCITYDFMNSNGEYVGGAISPGIRLRYEAMHNYTAKLPLLQIPDNYSLIGQTTETAMHSGVIQGVLSEIDGVVAQYKKTFNIQEVVITGGNGEFLSKQLKNSIFAHSNFLLEGLNYILTQTND